MPTVMQWTNHLLQKIERQKQYAAPFEKRYTNDYVLPFIAQEYREVYGARVDALLGSNLDAPRTGTAAIGIDALVERLTVLGANSDDPTATALIETAWEDNDLDVMHREAHREALIKSRSFATVTRSRDGSRAIVGIESPEQVAVHRMQAPPYDVDAMLKVWKDEWTGEYLGRLWLDGRDIDLRQTDVAVADPEPGSQESSRWVVTGETPSRVVGVPGVEFARGARLLAQPVSEIAPVVTLVDLVDLIEGLMVFAGHFGAVPIRYATGIEVQRDPKDPSKALLGPDGKPMVGFKPRADHFWASTSKDTRFGQLEPAGLASFVTWAEHATSRIRAKTSIASTYYSLDLKSHMSAELLKTDEAPMVRRVNGMGRDGSFNQSWRRVQGLILQIENPSLRARPRPRWADPETRVEAQATDSFQKVTAGGIGIAAAAEMYLGWDPEFVQQAVAEGEALRARKVAEQMDPIERLGREFLPEAV